MNWLYDIIRDYEWLNYIDDYIIDDYVDDYPWSFLIIW